MLTILSSLAQQKSQSISENVKIGLDYNARQGNAQWHRATVVSILKNGKYAGDLLIQKYVTTDFLTHKQAVKRSLNQQPAMGQMISLSGLPTISPQII